MNIKIEHMSGDIIESGGVKNVTQHIYGSMPQQGEDQHIKQAIKQLLNKTTEDGKPLMQNQGQWYAVYRILVDYCKWPTSMAAFCRRINDMGFELPIKCDEASLKKINVQPPFFKPFCEWKAMGNATQYDRQYIVAQTFKEIVDEG